VPSALSSLATAVMSLARWQVDERAFRLLMLLSAPVWGAHDFRVGSLPGMTAAAMTVATSLYRLARMHRARGADTAGPGGATG